MRLLKCCILYSISLCVLTIFFLTFLLLNKNNPNSVHSLTDCSINFSERHNAVKYIKINISDKSQNILKLWNINGNLIYEKNITIWNEPLKKWNPKKEILSFIHIGKSAGNSFSDALGNSILKVNNCQMKCMSDFASKKKMQPNCPEIQPIICGRHFDWTIIQKIEYSGHKVAPIIFLRNPIQRIVSHFYFLRKTSWSVGKKFRYQNLTEFFTDKESMMESRHLWNDGQVKILLLRKQVHKMSILYKLCYIDSSPICA